MSSLGPAITLIFSLLTYERPYWMQHWQGDQTVVPERSTWIKHKVQSRETLTQIAVRYGVTVENLRKWNGLGESAKPKVRKTIRVRAKRIPLPKQRVEHDVLAGETWGSVAADYGVSSRDLHAWNYRLRELEEGGKLVVWFDPAKDWTVGRHMGPLPNHRYVEPGALSVGKPQRGRIENAVLIPQSVDYTCRSERLCWGSSYAVEGMQRAFANFRYESGYEGEIVIGSISRKFGRRFPPHKSHQSGRDVDIRLPILPTVPDWRDPHRDEVDWMATWALVDALIDTGRVQTIFLESDLQRPLYEAARQLGRSHESLAGAITYPREKGKEWAIVRHSKGHDAHIHVRFKCGPDEPRCKG
jgi:murein endopeptidase/LysM repeat protein